jgi:hypothetical protein
LLQVAVYAGVPAANGAFAIAKGILVIEEPPELAHGSSIQASEEDHQ